MSYKTFQNGFPLPASDLNNYLMNQVVATFANSAARSSAIAAPQEGQVTYLENDDKYYRWNGSAWVELAGMTSQVSQALSPNYIINGAFDFWQRGTSFTGNQYAADRWQQALSGATATTNRQTFTVGQTDVPGNPTYFIRMATTTGDNNSRLQHFVEDVSTLAGQTATFSFYAKGTNPGGGSFDVQITQNFGSGGSANVETVIGTATLTSSWQRFTYTTTIPSITGKTVGAGSYLGVDIRQRNADTSTAAWTLDLANVQLEAGSVATPFRRNANSLQGELAACQRYYYRQTSPSAAYNAFGNGSAGNTTTILTTMKLPVTMRVAPTSIEWGSIVHSDGPNLITPSAITIGNATADTVTSQSTVTGATQFRPYTINANNSASAFIAFGAEL